MADMFKLDKIRTDGGTQARGAIRPDVVQEYMEALGEEGKELPPVVVFDDGQHKWLADGFHRIKAYKQVSRKIIPIEVIRGDLRDAQLYAAGANHFHGLRRSNEDKRQAVMMLLRDSEWTIASDRWIADKCHVSEHLVAAVRHETQSGERVSSNSSTAHMRSSENSGAENSQKRAGQDGKNRPPTQSTMSRAERLGLNRPPAPPKIPDGEEPTPTNGKLLCARCQQEEPVKGCSMCKELSKKPGDKPKKRADKPDDPENVPVDDFKNPLPKRCRDAYADPWVRESIDFLAVMIEKFWGQKMANGMEKRKKYHPFYIPKDFIDGCGMVGNTMQQLLDHLKDHRPAGVCPACGGKGCPACKMCGLVSRDLYKTLTEEKAHAGA